MAYQTINPLTNEVTHYEICRGCNEPIFYEEIYDGETIYVTPDDRAFHMFCWENYVLDNPDGDVV